MATAASEAVVASQRGNADAQARTAHDAAAAAWLCAIPCAALTAVAILLLGPPLGELLSPAHGYVFLAGVRNLVRPEPTEDARYLVAVCAPLLATVAILAAPHWLRRIPARAVTPCVVAAQLVIAGVVAASIAA